MADTPPVSEHQTVQDYNDGWLGAKQDSQWLRAHSWFQFKPATRAEARSACGLWRDGHVIPGMIAWSKKNSDTIVIVCKDGRIAVS